MPARYHGESGLVCDFERSFGRRCKLWVICVQHCKLWVIVSREGYSRLGAHVKDAAQTACRHNLIFTHLWCVFQQKQQESRHFTFLLIAFFGGFLFGYTMTDTTRYIFYVLLSKYKSEMDRDKSEMDRVFLFCRITLYCFILLFFVGLIWFDFFL